MKKIKHLTGWMDYDKEMQWIMIGSFTYRHPSTRHTNSYIVSKKVEVTVEYNEN